MKISKIFHWLYASLMFLPLAFIAGRSLYTIFNNNAKDSYSDQLVAEQLYINNTNQLVENQTYTFIYNNATTGNTPFIDYKSISINWTDYGFESTRTYTSFALFGNGQVILKDTGGNSIAHSNIWGNTLESFTMVSNVNTGNSSFIVANVYYNTYIQNKLDNAFIYSVNQLNEVPLFSWATNTYISQPLTYVTGLFGLEANNPINTLISYWFSVSIFWLVFDVMIYVPMMIHRWLDKGALE